MCVFQKKNRGEADALEPPFCVVYGSHPLPTLAVEFATLSLDGEGRPQPRIFRPSDITRLLQREGLAKEEEGGDAPGAGMSAAGAGTATGEAMAVDS